MQSCERRSVSRSIPSSSNEINPTQDGSSTSKMQSENCKVNSNTTVTNSSSKWWINSSSCSNSTLTHSTSCNHYHCYTYNTSHSVTKWKRRSQVSMSWVVTSNFQILLMQQVSQRRRSWRWHELLHQHCRFDHCLVDYLLHPSNLVEVGLFTLVSNNPQSYNHIYNIIYTVYIYSCYIYC